MCPPVLFAGCSIKTGNTGWAQVGAGAGICLLTRRTDRPFVFKPLGLVIASWFREVPAHMVLNGCLHWGKQGIKGRWVIPDYIQGCSLRGKGFSPCSQFFLWVNGVGEGNMAM